MNKTSYDVDPNRSWWSFWLVSLALIAGLILSILSWMELCVEHCAANQDYRLFGLTFSQVGIPFFILTSIFHFFSLRVKAFSKIVCWLIASALGAEIVFIAVQHYQIGHWCPVCLSIAGTVALAAVVLSIGYFRELKNHVLYNRGKVMVKIKQAFISLFFALAGFLMAFTGIGKANTAEASANDIKEKIAFGTKKSPVEVYFVTDWYCPACKKIEPEIEKIYPKIQSQVAFYFIDYPIHKKSLNFTPYNLAFLMNDKAQYFKARQGLRDLSEKTENPNDEDVARFASKQGLFFRELSFLDIKAGIEYFDHVVTKYNLHATPTIIITQPYRNQTIKLEGRDEISGQKVMEAIEKLKQPHS